MPILTGRLALLAFTGFGHYPSPLLISHPLSPLPVMNVKNELHRLFPKLARRHAQLNDEYVSYRKKLHFGKLKKCALGIGPRQITGRNIKLSIDTVFLCRIHDCAQIVRISLVYLGAAGENKSPARGTDFDKLAAVLLHLSILSGDHQ